MSLKPGRDVPHHVGPWTSDLLGHKAGFIFHYAMPLTATSACQVRDMSELRLNRVLSRLVELLVVAVSGRSETKEHKE